MTTETQDKDLLQLTANIVSAHIANNPMAADALPGMIQEVYRTLSGLGKAPPEAEKPIPAVPVNRSVFADNIVCLEDGKKLKMLKRHLSTSYGMTPEQYRAKWGLPRDYPMTAPNYAKVRSGLAKKIGLGKKAAAAEGTEVAPKKAARKQAPKKVAAKKAARKAPTKKAAAAA